MTLPAALIFDVDGTLADTESIHLRAFNEAFAQHGLPFRWDAALYTGLLEISGGKERITHYLRTAGPLPGPVTDSELIARLHAIKTEVYEAIVAREGLPLRGGVQDLIEHSLQAGVALAIATTTTPANVDALLTRNLGASWRACFKVVEDASTAPHKKPHPQVYLQALQRLGLSASDCVALEDSANGLQAATRCGLATVVTPTVFTRHQNLSGACRVLPSLEGATLEALADWRDQWLAAQSAPNPDCIPESCAEARA